MLNSRSAWIAFCTALSSYPFFPHSKVSSEALQFVKQQLVKRLLQ